MSTDPRTRALAQRYQTEHAPSCHEPTDAELLAAFSHLFTPATVEELPAIRAELRRRDHWSPIYAVPTV